MATKKITFATINNDALYAFADFNMARVRYNNASAVEDPAVRKSIRDDANYCMKKAVFEILATAEEKSALGRRNANRPADKKPYVGVAHVIHDAVCDYYDALRDGGTGEYAFTRLVGTVKDWMISIGFGNVDDKSVSKWARALVTAAPLGRVSAKKGLDASGAFAVDKAIVYTAFMLCIETNSAFDIADDGNITRHDFSKDAKAEDAGQAEDATADEYAGWSDADIRKAEKLKNMTTERGCSEDEARTASEKLAHLYEKYARKVA